MASLVEDEQELGSACIDMGGGTTSLSIFMKKHMIYADTVRLGGDHVTRDISMGLQVPIATAERIKTRSGGLMATGMDDRDMIEIGGDTGDWEHDRRTISRTELIGIMRPRVEEILEEVRAHLDAAGFEHLPSQQIVLTGGASQKCRVWTPWPAAFWGSRCALAAPCVFIDCHKPTQGLSCSALVGVSLFAAHPQDEWWDFEVPAHKLGARSIRKALRWFKENW